MITTLQDEEREARTQDRNLARARREKAKADDKRRRQTIGKAIMDTKRDYPRCRCEIRVGVGDEELRELGAGCTNPMYTCPRLDAVRRLVGR